MEAENSVEDYWEDASVSWGCRGLSLSSFLHTPAQEAQKQGLKPSSMQDFHIASSPLRPRNFPPPITSLCTTLSIKAGGRFVLKEMASLPPHGLLRAERERGRLCLHLIEPKPLDEDADEDDDYTNYDNACELEDAAAVCMNSHQQEHQDDYKTVDTENINVSIMSNGHSRPDAIQGAPQDSKEAVVEEAECMPEKHARTEEFSTSEHHAIEHIETSRDMNSIGACMPTVVHANEIEFKNGGGASMGMSGIGQHQRSALWSKEGSNDISASLIPCSSKQVLPHQSFTSTRMSLAVS